MTTFGSKFAAVVVVTGLALAQSAPLLAEQRVAKDTGPTSAACDGFAKGTAAWTACVGQPTAKMADAELFYAGYWLAKSGQYEQALGYLTQAKQQDERVLTYIGYATRKLGHVDEALPFYRQALATNPNYVVARAYMGEAFLTKQQPDLARGELKEIAQRCGVTCPAFVDLETQIKAYDAGALKG